MGILYWIAGLVVLAVVVGGAVWVANRRAGNSKSSTTGLGL